MKKRYRSKVILFGEYSMIFDSTALVVPLKRFSAGWTDTAERRAEFREFSKTELSRFCRYLKEQPELSEAIDCDAFAKDPEAGWIPK